MEHWKIIRNDNLDVIDLEDFDVNSLIEHYYNNNRVCVYVYKEKELLGVIGRKEIELIREKGVLVINKSFVFLVEQPETEKHAERLFDENPQIWNVPVVGDNGRVLYEFKKSFEKYYEDLDISEGVNTDSRAEKIVVSLTSHGLRLNTVYIAIRSIMAQSLRPDIIVLYLDEDSGDKKIVNEDELIRAGLVIKRNVENLRPHCKYYYAFQDYPDDIVITVDDDIIYPDNLIGDLYHAHLKFKDAVIAHRAHKAFDNDGNELLVRDYLWEVSTKKPEKFLCATGVGGVLYPPGEYRKAFLDREAIKNLSLNADDIWLMYMEAMMGIKVYALEPYKMRTVESSQDEIGLSLKNDVENENQIWLENLEKHFGKTLKQLIDG